MDKKVRILQVITSLLYGGAEKLVAEISPLLCEDGFEVDVLAFNGEEPNFRKQLEDKGIKVITFGNKVNVYNPIFIWKLVKMMKMYDIVHTHNTSPQLFAAIGSVLLRAKRGLNGDKGLKCPKLVTTEHNTYNRRRSIPVLKYVDRWMYSRYQSIICISDKAEFNLREFVPRMKNICTIYNGVNVQAFHEARPIAGLHPDGKIVVVMVAAFREQKDQKTLIDAIRRLPEEKYELWLVGDGKLHDEIHGYIASLFCKKLLDNSNSLESYGNIKLFGNRSDVPEILNSADIVVMSSHYEGLSLSSVEGMSVGKPFIASDVDGLREVVEGYGILVPHADSTALAVEIKRLADNPAYYKKVADKCWERARMYDIQKMVDGYERVYLEVMGESNG